MISNLHQIKQIQYQSYNSVYTNQNGHHIYLGDISAATDLQFIKQKQIGLVVTAAANIDHIEYQSHIKHLVYHLIDCKSENMRKYFQSFYDLVEQEIQRTNILIHCLAGISRSATLVISYIMKKKNLTFKEAITEVRQHRPKVLPNLGFQRQLKQYQKVINSQEMIITRKYISKTSQARKHFKKPSQIALPEIYALGKTLVKSKNFNMIISPKLQPSSQMESRKINIRYFEQQRKSGNVENSLNKYDSCSFQLPVATFRKQSISISRRKNKLMSQSQQIQPQSYKRLAHKLVIQNIKFKQDKISRSEHQNELYFH